MTSDDPTGQIPIQPPPRQPPQAPPVASATPTATPPPPQPTWRPPAADRGRSASLILGVLFLLVGGWFFATTTLGLDLPDLDWGQFWPVILIVIGLGIVLRSLDRARS